MGYEIMTPETPGYPFTGALVILVNNTPGPAVKAATDAIAELFTEFCDEDLSVTFSLTTDNGPCLYINGPAGFLESMKDYADRNYPRLAAEWEQV